MLYNHAHGGAYEIGKEELIRGRYPCGHMETAAMRTEALSFVEEWLEDGRNRPAG